MTQVQLDAIASEGGSPDDRSPVGGSPVDGSLDVGTLDDGTAVVQIPVEVSSPAAVFPVTARGYSRRPVDAYVAALEQELAELRWQQDDLAAEQHVLAEQRAAQATWQPSFSALGRRAAEILRLADEEAAALRADAVRLARRDQREATAETARLREQQAAELLSARRAGERELRQLEASVQTRRALLEGELAHLRRDAELEVTGRLAQAGAQAHDLRAAAAREAEQVVAVAQAEVERLHRRRQELARELTELSHGLVAVVHRLERTDTPLEVDSA